MSISALFEQLDLTHQLFSISLYIYNIDIVLDVS